MDSFQGKDATGETEYPAPEALWQEVKAKPEGKEQAWYAAAVAYWDSQEASVNGVLGGYGHVSGPDLQESEKFLLKAYGQQLKQARVRGQQPVAADCGAGVGRVSEGLLLHHFAQVDLVEPSAHLLSTARQRLHPSSRAGAARPWPVQHVAGECMQLGLQQWKPAAGRYDVIWIQWALLYLTDDDAIALFQRCKAALKPHGIVIVKENICREGFIVDKEDSSLTRSNKYMLELFRKANMLLIHNVAQRNFPQDLFQVRMYAIKPKAESS